MSRKYGNPFRLFRRDTRGVAAIEFAFVAMLLVAGLLNAVDVGRYEYQLMQVENAAEVGAQAAWATCNDPTTMLPATQNCNYLNSTVAAAIQKTSLGSSVSLASGYPAEGYYCVNASNTLQLVGGVGSRPVDCTAAGNASAIPSDYVRIGVTFTYTPLFPGISVMSAMGTTAVIRISWRRLG